MKNSRWLSVLMAITILVIVAFQIYWIRNNYQREKKILEQKTGFLFEQTIRKLQTKNIRLSSFFKDSIENGINIKDGKNDSVKVHFNSISIKISPEQEAAEYINIIGDKLSDSIRKGKAEIFIASDGKHQIKDLPENPGKRDFTKRNDNRMFNFINKIDSLQEPIRLPEIDSACIKAFKKEHISVPFIIDTSEADTIINEAKSGRFMFFNDTLTDDARNTTPGRITIGILHPKTYELKLGNSFPYLAKRISSPILFSIFLIGVTVLSFLLLFRNLVKEKRLTEIKNDFIGNITHELKTPIATVGVAIEALQNFNAINDPAKTKEYLDISQNELNRLSMLVDKVLKLSMFEKEELILSKENFDLQAVIDEVVRSFQLQFEKSKAVCTTDMHGSNFFINADKMHTASVVYNLVDNALKYTPENPAIHISLNEENEMIILKVSDNGMGIPAAYREKVFEKFFRVPAGDIHNIKGYGLGLSYVAQVIKKHKGTVSVKSNPEKGTAFIIKIPKANGGQ